MSVQTELRFVGYGVGETLSKAEKKASPEAINARRWGGAAIVAWCARNADAVALVRTHDVQVRRDWSHHAADLFVVTFLLSS